MSSSGWGCVYRAIIYTTKKLFKIDYYKKNYMIKNW